MPQRPNRSDPVKHKADVDARNRAWRRAVKALIDEFPEEYDRLYEEQARQVDVKPIGRQVNSMRRRIRQLKAELAELEAREGGDGGQ